VALWCLSGVPSLCAQDAEAEAVAPIRPFDLMSRMVLGQKDSVALIARKQVGLRYKYGAKQPGKAFDCSALVQHVLSFFDVDLPRTAHEQATAGVEVPRDSAQLEVGDLLYFGRGKRIQHVGIYIGDGRYVHAANRRKGVIESALPTGTRRSAWWKGVRRLLHLPEAAAADSALMPLNPAPQRVPDVAAGSASP
jgi:hypothetical protein